MHKFKLHVQPYVHISHQIRAQLNAVKCTVQYSTSYEQKSSNYSYAYKVLYVL